MSFREFNLAKEIQSNVEASGYVKPTPIQARAIPVVLQGHDVLGLAQTGTGKTAAFVLPILHRLLQGKSLGRPRALIVVPTRELAEQIYKEIRVFGSKTHLKGVTVYGGVSSHRQIMDLRRGVDIVIACPGRLLDHLQQKHIDLTQIQTLVLDEADRLFDMGFLPDIKRLLNYIPYERQTLLFSATMPQEVNRFANHILKQPQRIEIDHDRPLGTISHVMFPVAAHKKTELLVEILKGTELKSIIVFTRTKHQAKSLSQKLHHSGYSAISLQGNLSQRQRQQALDGFRSGEYQILVATDIAARGIDVSHVSHVINYDIPDTTDAYTHRTGRTGRASNIGEAFTLVTNSDKRFMSMIERRMGAKIQTRTIAGFECQPQEKLPVHHKFTRKKPFFKRKFKSSSRY